MSPRALILVVGLASSCVGRDPNEFPSIDTLDFNGLPGNDLVGFSFDLTMDFTGQDLARATVPPSDGGAVDAAGPAVSDLGRADDLLAGDLRAPADLAGGPKTWTVHVGPVGELRFDPDQLTIHVGDTVHWIWDSGGHSVTGGSNGNPDGKFCSPTDLNCNQGAISAAGATYNHGFKVAGSYPYFCDPHWGAGMTGTITVQP